MHTQQHSASRGILQIKLIQACKWPCIGMEDDK